jgi:hypothetical protein
MRQINLSAGGTWTSPPVEEALFRLFDAHRRNSSTGFS